MSIKRQNFFIKNPRLTILLIFLGLLIFKVIATIMCINLAMYISSRDHLYTPETVSAMPDYEYGLLLGTSEKVRGGTANPHFWNRIEAAVQLYKSGKIQKIIASGDPRPGRQNEVAAMRSALIAKGVAEEDIILDPKGLRTIASIQQAKEQFGLQRMVIISQKYHNYRAVYLAKFYEIEVSAYCAVTPPFNQSIITRLREIGARVKAVLDILEIAHEEWKNQPQKG